MERSRTDWAIIMGCCMVLFFLWLPGVQYPIVSDTAVYALLGEHLWQHGTYVFFGEPYAKHLPLHALLSYPFVSVFGYGLGMKVSSLVAGWGVLAATYLLLTKTLSRQVALLSVALLTVHHGFVLMTHFGSADLLFAALFLFAVFAYSQSGTQKRWYLLAFGLAGLASLTRYNGVPLFALFLGHAFLYRRNDLKSAPYIGGLGLGLGLIGSWFTRNFLVFGDPLYTEYTAELSKESLGFIGQIVSNAVFYISPTRNLLPILLLCALYGLWKYGRTQKFLVAAMLTAWLLTSCWWVQGMRFAFPGYPILMGFAVMGLLDVCRTIRRPVLVGFLIVLTHLPALCLYSYGSCNAWFDRSVGLLPQNLGLSSEGFHTWSLARDYVNEHALPEAYVDVTSPLLATVWQQGVFRSDLRPVENTKGLCPAYRIDEDPEGGNILFQTESFPKRYVHLFDCS